jgi:uncharacterized protein
MPPSRIFIQVAVFALLTSQFLSAQSPNAPKLFERGMNALEGSSAGHDNLAAVDLLRSSADLGYAPAQVALGYLYDTGTILAAESGQAQEWYRKAAQQDDPLAEWLLGRLIFAGTGTLHDLNEAARWLEKAAAHGDPFGEYLLGRVELERSHYALAADWFRQASMLGLPQAQQYYGRALAQGRGVELNKFDAYVWLLISYDAGNNTITNDLQSLEADLGSTALEQAKTKARQLEGTVGRSAAAHACTGWPGEFGAIPDPPPLQLQRFCR